MSDLGALVSSTQGKVEIEALEEGREERILHAPRLRQRCSRCSGAGYAPRTSRGIVAAFDDKRVVHAGDDLPASAYAETLAGAGARHVSQRLWRARRLRARWRAPPS